MQPRLPSNHDVSNGPEDVIQGKGERDQEVSGGCRCSTPAGSLVSLLIRRGLGATTQNRPVEHALEPALQNVAEDNLFRKWSDDNKWDRDVTPLPKRHHRAGPSFDERVQLECNEATELTVRDSDSM